MIAILDGARRAAFGWALDIAPLQGVLVNKDRRIAIHAVICVLSACAIAIGLPIVPLIVAPLLLGIPHLASELRWLVLRRSLPRPFLLVVAPLAIALAVVAGLDLSPRVEVALAMLALLVAQRVLATSRVEPPRRQDAKGEGTQPFGTTTNPSSLFGALGALAVRSHTVVDGLGAWCSSWRTSRWIRHAIVALSLAVAAVAIASTAAAAAIRDVAVAAHGFVALAAWVALFRRRRRYALPAILLTLVGSAIVLAMRGPIVALAFLQSVHYAVWLVLVPQDAVSSEGTPTFAMSARAWRRDLGVPALVILAIASLGLLAGAIVLGAERARDVYLAFARFHVWVELVLFSFLFFRRPT